MTCQQMTDKEFLQKIQQRMLEGGFGEEFCSRLQSIIDNMPDKEKLLEETLKRVDKLCEERNSITKFVEGAAYKADELLFAPSIKASNV